MEINSKKFSWEASLTSGFVYTVCTAFVVLFPSFSGQLLGWLTHIMNLELLQRGIQVTLGSYLAGLGQVLLYVYIFARIFSWLFNRAVNK